MGRAEDADRFWLLTEEGIWDGEGNPREAVPFQGTSVDAGHHRDGRTAVVVDEHEIWVHEEGWRKILATEASLQCLAWTPEGRLLVGTEPARVAYATDEGLRYLEGFDAIPERALWTTPWGGPPAVRSLAVATDGTLYANVHVGWISRSRDGGEGWTCLRQGLEMDVHQVTAHPTEAGTVFAATADGFHLSKDHGDTFDRRVKGLPNRYLRACARFPDRDVHLVSASQGSGGRGAALFRSEDEGRTWRRVKGLPENLARNINTHQVAVREGGEGLAIVGDTALYGSTDWGTSWAPLHEALPRVWSVVAR